MTERSQRSADVLGALPHRRPTRRSDKRTTSAPRNGGGCAAPPTAPRAKTRSTPSQAKPPPTPGRPRGGEIAGTMVQAAAELAEIGIVVTARTVRQAVARLPRP